MKYVALLAAALALGACNASNVVPVASVICTEADALQASGISLNANEQLALTTIVADCAATSGGVAVNGATLENIIIEDALLLQQSGLFSDIHISALATEHPVQAKVLKKIKAHWGFH